MTTTKSRTPHLAPSLPLRSAARVDKQGRILIPAEIREQLGVKPGDKLNLVMKGRELRVLTLDEAIRQLQDYVEGITGGRKGILDEFIAERRREAERK